MPDLRHSLLRIGFGGYDGTYVSGVTANNKLELDYGRLAQDSELLRTVVERLGSLAVQHNPDLILAVPNGANGYAREVARQIGVGHVLLGKSGNKQPFFVGNSKQIIEQHARIVILEDVINGLTSTRRVMGLSAVAERTVGVVGIWDRGDDGRRLPLPDGVELDALVKEYIPAQLDDASELWRYAT